MNDEIGFPPKPFLVRILKWKFLTGSVLLIGTIAIGLTFRASRIMGIPDIGDPFDVEQFVDIDIAPEDNALKDYEAAVAAVVPLAESFRDQLNSDLDAAYDGRWDAVRRDVQQWVRDNAKAIELWKQGTEKKSYIYHNPRDGNIITLLPVVQGIRNVARIAVLDISRLLAEEKPHEAWLRCRALMRCSRHVATYGTAIERLVAAVTYAQATHAALTVCEHAGTDESLLEEMMEDVREIYQKTVPLSMVVKCNYLMMKNTYHNRELMMGNEIEFWPRLELQAANFLLNEPRHAQLVWQQYTANVLDQIDRPRREQQARIGIFELFERDPATEYPENLLTPDVLEQKCHESTLAEKTIPDLGGLEHYCLQEHVRKEALVMAIGARMYYLQYGEYPMDLETLVDEGLLDEYPLDPSSYDVEVMGYRVEGNKVYIWGNGDDGVNNDGRWLESDNPEHQYVDIGIILGREKDDSVEAQKP
ncbi:MAG: hypothetical protein WD065_05185 [Planctomycetaceae bacterium]